MIGSIFLGVSAAISMFNIGMICYREIDMVRRVRTKLNKEFYDIKGKNKDIIESTMITIDNKIDRDTLLIIEVVMSIPPLLNLYLFRININRLRGINNEYIDEEYDKVVEECTSYKVTSYLEKKGLIKRNIRYITNEREDGCMKYIKDELIKDFNAHGSIKLSDLLKKYDAYELNEELSNLCGEQVITATYEDDPTFHYKNKKLVLKKGKEDE